jgi:hypothetical protein
MEELQGPRDLTHSGEELGDKNLYHPVHELVGNWRGEERIYVKA